MLSDKHIALGITGSIAAYKAVLILRELKKLGARVTVVMTRHAQKFITPLTLEVLSEETVLVDTFSQDVPRLEHINLARQSDLLLVAPATANIIGKFASGIADDFLSTLYLALCAPTLIAPAMNKDMYNHPVVQSNIQTLEERGVEFISPQVGELACGVEGPGRLAEVELIVTRVTKRLAAKTSLTGKSILVTAGPTREYIDRLRFISNSSSGKMGYAIAKEAKLRGARVTLISGPTNLSAPHGVEYIGIDTAKEMYQAVLKHLNKADALIMAAAVGDYTPAEQYKGKLKKGTKTLNLELAPTTDILAEVSRKKKNQLIVGFAAEVEQVVVNARRKLKQKKLDIIIANDVSLPGVGFGYDTNAVTIIDKEGQIEEHPLTSKTRIAQIILDKIEHMWINYAR